MTPALTNEIVSTLIYFILAAIILVAGFVILDLLTPGKLYRLVFVDHLPNAAFFSAAQQVSLGIVVATAVHTSGSGGDMWHGIIEAGVLSALGLVLQAAALVILEMLIPGKFRNLVEDTKLRAGAIVASVSLIVIGVVNAACLT